MVEYRQITGKKSYTDKIEKVTPFGAQYLTKAAKLGVKPVREWNWEPANGDLEQMIEIMGSIGGTTGTGPRMREDEIRDEM